MSFKVFRCAKYNGISKGMRLFVYNITMINKREIANDLVTLRDLIRWGTSQFNAAELSFVQGMPTAIDEAVYLCLSACICRRISAWNILIAC